MLAKAYIRPQHQVRMMAEEIMEDAIRVRQFAERREFVLEMGVEAKLVIVDTVTTMVVVDSSSVASGESVEGHV